MFSIFKPLKQRYVQAGLDFANNVKSATYIHKRTSSRKFSNWQRLEEQYAQQGFRPLSLDDFVKSSLHGDSIDTVLGVKREEDEPVELHAPIYKERFPDGVHFTSTTIGPSGKLPVVPMPSTTKGSYKKLY